MCLIRDMEQANRQRVICSGPKEQQGFRDRRRRLMTNFGWRQIGRGYGGRQQETGLVVIGKT